jgi:regulator of replication initiation timing
MKKEHEVIERINALQSDNHALETEVGALRRRLMQLSSENANLKGERV